MIDLYWLTYFASMVLVILTGPKIVNLNDYSSDCNTPIVGRDISVAFIAGIIPVINTIVVVGLVWMLIDISLKRINLDWMDKPVFKKKTSK